MATPMQLVLIAALLSCTCLQSTEARVLLGLSSLLPKLCSPPPSSDVPYTPTPSEPSPVSPVYSPPYTPTPSEPSPVSPSPVYSAPPPYTPTPSGSSPVTPSPSYSSPPYSPSPDYSSPPYSPSPSSPSPDYSSPLTPRLPLRHRQIIPAPLLPFSLFTIARLFQPPYSPSPSSPSPDYSSPLTPLLHLRHRLCTRHHRRLPLILLRCMPPHLQAGTKTLFNMSHLGCEKRSSAGVMLVA